MQVLHAHNLELPPEMRRETLIHFKADLEQGNLEQRAEERREKRALERAEKRALESAAPKSRKRAEKGATPSAPQQKKRK